MSTNCVSCVRNERTGTDLLCDSCRDVLGLPTAKELIAALCVTLDEDFLLALRYCYYVKALPLTSDATYDKIERRFMATAPDDTLLMNPGSDSEADYSDKVKAMAMYLLLSTHERGTRKHP